MLIEGWGRHPIVDAELSRPQDSEGVRARLRAGGSLIAQGMGRSYGDSALAPRVLQSGRLDLLLGFDPGTGVLDCQAGVSLDEILNVFVPRGWFPAVTPGTKYVSVGGAIAADVHGKNHHSAGCFSESVESLDLMGADGAVQRCSRAENPELFHASCGGMGLTGVILRARLRLRPVSSALISQTTYKAGGLDELLERFEDTRSLPFSVAWIDCLSRGKALGRSVLDVGDFAPVGPLAPHPRPRFSVPVVPPWSPVTPLTNRILNAFLYHHVLRRERSSRVHYESFFYPLDKIAHWNRLYGKTGFAQHQFVIPAAAGPKGLRGLLEAISASGLGSFLGVLKVMGAANANPLSFPMAGYTLALDYKVAPGLFRFLDELDARVLDLGGRVYLAKDARLGEKAFKRMYPRWQEFQQVREKNGAKGRFASLQSRRLGLD
ncbi:MAG TPA: FAD-binding oxidoreductase [bacterium]|jgi:decaprenylphospho-beta-D-ribofuranose 2-oxidase|nr:FAD-binding oxidoreductase [bacterium]